MGNSFEKGKISHEVENVFSVFFNCTYITIQMRKEVIKMKEIKKEMKKVRLLRLDKTDQE